MTPMTFYFGALGLFVLGVLCIRGTSLHADSGGDDFVWRRRRRTIGLLLLIAAALGLAAGMMKQSFSRNWKAVALNPASFPSRTGQPPTSQGSALLQQAIQLLGKNQPAAALDKVNAALQIEPQNPEAYYLRGNIDAAEKLWSSADGDYRTALQLNDKNPAIKFNLAEIQFMQKNFDAARPGFVALQPDPVMGDLARYKVFLCDLFGGHEEVAAKELNAFNQVGENASYYFANAAWSLYHQKPDEARGWLASAGYIYPPAKFRVYSASLIELGYPGRLHQQAPPTAESQARPTQ